MNKTWTKEDIEQLIENYTQRTPEELISLFSVSWSAIKTKAQKLGLNRQRKIVDEEAIIIDYKTKVPIEELYRKYGVSQHFLYRLLNRHQVVKNNRPASEVKEKVVRVPVVKEKIPIVKVEKLKPVKAKKEKPMPVIPPPMPFTETHAAIKEWLNSFDLNFNDDLYEDTLNLQISYCELATHTDQHLANNYHNSHRLACEAQGIRLITIFEDEWLEHEEAVKNFLKTVLGKNTTTIFARKCEVREITKAEGQAFFKTHHIQGKNGLGLYFVGLFYKDELISAMSFGRHHRKAEQLTLDRFCVKPDLNIPGGASKLFKFILALSGKNEIISWSDSRWSQGKVYFKLGFVVDEVLQPDYSYVSLMNPTYRVSKQSQKKKETNCPEGLTEKQWTAQRGLFRIWDCGKIRWKFTKV